eukprot:COSAG02_NODE_4676_length_5104_cov_43.285514_1_plen_61_part_00
MMTVFDGWRKMLNNRSILRQPSQTGPREYMGSVCEGALYFALVACTFVHACVHSEFLERV